MTHSFHIPVLGLAFSVDTAIKVAQFGISSVVSIVDDELLERLRAYYSQENQLEYEAIEEHMEDARARRITAYLDMIQVLVDKQLVHLKNCDWLQDETAIKYFSLLPEQHPSRNLFQQWRDTNSSSEKERLKTAICEAMIPGDIDVNIMSKVDKINYSNDGEMLSEYYSDATAAVRGFANSTLRSSVVLSAGMNPRLYGQLQEFPQFFPDEQGEFNKK